MQEDKDLDQESRNNLERYALLVWKIFQRKQDETETKNSDDESLRNQWEKQFKN